MELKELLEGFAAHVGDPKTAEGKLKVKGLVELARKKPEQWPEDVREAMPVFTALVQKAFDAGTGRKGSELTPRITELEGEVEKLTRERDEAVAAADAAKKEPAEREQQLERKVQDLQAKLDAATNALTEERTAHLNDKGETYVDKVLMKLKGRIKDDYLDEVVANRIRKQVRVKPDKSVVLLPPGDEVPYEAKDEREAMALLAEDIYQGVHTDYRISVTDPGSGGSGGQGGGRRPGEPDIITKKAQDFNAQRAARGTNPLLAGRPQPEKAGT